MELEKISDKTYSIAEYKKLMASGAKFNKKVSKENFGGYLSSHTLKE